MRFFDDIPIKYRTHRTGPYNAGVYICPHCGYDPHKQTPKGAHADNILGFENDTGQGVTAVCECPKCFEKWWHHARLRRLDDDRDMYDLFLVSLQDGTQRHHKLTS